VRRRGLPGWIGAACGALKLCVVEPARGMFPNFRLPRRNAAAQSPERNSEVDTSRSPDPSAANWKMITLDDTDFHLQPHEWPCRACVRVEAATLRDALAAAERYYGVTLRAHHERKWFRVYYPPDHRYHARFAKRNVEEQFELVDVHIMRNEKMICPGQDLDFALLPRDTVRFLQFVC
jgi:hypothetical protein